MCIEECQGYKYNGFIYSSYEAAMNARKEHREYKIKDKIRELLESSVKKRYALHHHNAEFYEAVVNKATELIFNDKDELLKLMKEIE